MNVSWAASTDDRGVSTYRVYRGGTAWHDTTDLHYLDSGLTPATRYCYGVSARDAAGNESAQTAQQCATTPSSGSTSYALTVNKDGPGSGTVSGGGVDCGSTCSASISQGTKVTLTASPTSGYFGSWTGCDSTNGATCTVTMNANRTVTATFTADTLLFGLTVSKNGTGSGTVTGTSIDCGSTCSAHYASGTSVTLTASPSTGSTFTSWSGCDSMSGATCTVTMNAAKTVTATFTAQTTYYTLTVSKNGTGSGLVTATSIDCGSTCSASYASGTSVTLTASTGSGSVFSSWSGCDSTSGANCAVTMNTAKTVTATFTAQTCAPNATRCVTKHIDVQETCNPQGTAWVQSACGDWRLCSNGQCRAVCEITSPPTYPTFCVVPNGDGVNDGDWMVWTDARLAYPTYAVGGSVDGSKGGARPSYSSGEAWPYAWSIDGFAPSDAVYVNFRLDQFGAYRHPRLSFRSKRSGTVNDGTNYYVVRIFKGNSVIASCEWANVPQSIPYSFASDDCTVGSYNTQLDYSGGTNGMWLGNVGNGLGSTPDIIDVEYVKLTIEP